MKRSIRFQKQDGVFQYQSEIWTFDPEEKMTQVQYRKILDTAISRLAPQQQQVYRLIREKSLKREEVAAIMQISPETVKSYLAQAIKNIRAFCKANMHEFFWIFISLDLMC